MVIVAVRGGMSIRYRLKAATTSVGRVESPKGQNGNYRFARSSVLEIPLFPESNCNRLRALAIVVLRDRMAIILEGNRCFGDIRIVAHNLEVMGSNPIPATESWVSKSRYPRVITESQGPAALAFRVSRPFSATTCDNRRASAIAALREIETSPVAPRPALNGPFLARVSVSLLRRPRWVMRGVASAMANRNRMVQFSEGTLRETRRN